MKLGRKDPCPCGSGKKYKRCCYPKFGTAEQQAAAESPPPAVEEAAGAGPPQHPEKRGKWTTPAEPRGGKPGRTGNAPPAQVMTRRRAV